MKNILSFLSILVLSINLSAQQFELKGRIIDKVSSEGIVGANVGLYRMPDSTLITGIQTDANGNFIIPNIPLFYFIYNRLNNCFLKFIYLYFI